MFPNSTLYDDDKVLEAMLNGDVQLAAPSLSKFETFTKKFRIFDLPFVLRMSPLSTVFQNSEDGEKLKNAMARRGLKGLAFWHNGMKQIRANRPLIKPEDAKGLKFRVQASDVLVAQFDQLGRHRRKCHSRRSTAACRPRSSTARKTPGPTSTASSSRCRTVSPRAITGFSTTSWSRPPFWDGLPDDVRGQLSTILKEVTEERNAVSTKVNEDNKQSIIAAGGVVRTLTPEQRQAWVEAMKPVWKKFER